MSAGEAGGLFDHLEPERVPGAGRNRGPGKKPDDEPLFDSEWGTEVGPAGSADPDRPPGADGGPAAEGAGFGFVPSDRDLPTARRALSGQATPGTVLREVFGFDAFRPHQAEVIEALLAGRDAFVLMPTGGGKSLCFQVPALLLRGTTIVVSPLIALMKDQVDALVQNGVAAACYNSSLGGDEARRVLARLHAGELDLLYVAPERLLQPEFLERLASLEPHAAAALFAIDEAHCVSEWGHDFRPEYAQLAVLAERFPGVPRVALTATADAQTRGDIARVLRLHEPLVVVAGFDRPNIRYTVVAKQKPEQQLADFIGPKRGQSGIVYALSRKRVEAVAEALRRRGVAAEAYHAGLPGEERHRVQDAFLKDGIDVVVATVAFGMGIDKSNVRFVVHYDLPRHVEGYYQETGRAGRDGLHADALLLFGWGDVMIARSLIEGGDRGADPEARDPERVRVERFKLDAMVAFASAQTCRRRALLGYFGEDLPADCGNCDPCLDPPEDFDATRDAQMALSCIVRTGQSFGMAHVVDVLRGGSGERIVRLGHDRLSTWGIGKERSREDWMALLQQLVHRGYVVQDVARWNVLRLTAKARSLLRGDEVLRLALPRAADPFGATSPTAARETKRRRRDERRREKRARQATITVDGVEVATGEDVAWESEERPGGDEALFEALRSLRKRLADEQKVPAYVVFSDATLRSMCSIRPCDEEQMLTVSGVGQAKLARYGEVFLAEIAKQR